MQSIAEHLDANMARWIGREPVDRNTIEWSGRPASWKPAEKTEQGKVIRETEITANLG